MNTHTMTRLTASLAGTLALLLQTNLNAQTLDPWQTVDDFQLVPGLISSSSAIGTDATGALLFAVGSGHTDTANHYSGVINRSKDGGQTWATVDVFAPPPGRAGAAYLSLTADPVSGRLFAGGSTPDTSHHWFVRRSDDGGDTWSTEELFQNPSICADVKTDAAGNIYAGGALDVTTPAYDIWTVRRRDAISGVWKTVDAFGTKSAPGAINRLAVHPTAGVFAVGYTYVSGVLQWTVRRSPNGISSWKTVDSFALGKGMISDAYGVATGGPGTIYVVGVAYSTVNRQQVSNWVVRRSTNGGTTWTTVDTFRYSNHPYTPYTYPYAAAVDAAGAVWVAGNGQTSTGPDNHWLVRKGTPNPATGAIIWGMSDDYQAVSGEGATPLGITTDATGNLFVSGNAHDGSGVAQWIVRRLAEP